MSYDYHFFGILIRTSFELNSEAFNARSSTKDFFLKTQNLPALTVAGGHRNRSLTGIPKSTKKRIHPKRQVLPFLSRARNPEVF